MLSCYSVCSVTFHKETLWREEDKILVHLFCVKSSLIFFVKVYFSIVYSIIQWSCLFDVYLHSLFYPTADGNWTPWSNYGVCSLSCGGGRQDRTRSCTNPAPKDGGDKCLGSYVSSQSCNTNKCPGKSSQIYSFIILITIKFQNLLPKLHQLSGDSHFIIVKQ